MSVVDRLLLTPAEAAQVLGIGRSKMYDLLRAEAIRSVRIGSCRRVPLAALEEYVAALPPSPVPDPGRAA